MCLRLNTVKIGSYLWLIFMDRLENKDSYYVMPYMARPAVLGHVFLTSDKRYEWGCQVGTLPFHDSTGKRQGFGQVIVFRRHPWCPSRLRFPI